MITGWEHDLPEDDSILRQWLLTNLTRYRHLTERVEGRIDVWDAAALFDTGSRVMMDNAVVLRRPVSADELSEVLDTAHIFFPEDLPWLFLSVWPLPDLSDAGLQLMGHPPFMLRPPAPPPERRPPAGLEVRDVTADSAPLFAEIVGSGFGLPGTSTSPWSDGRAFGDDVKGYLGYLDGEPVATSAAVLSHGVVDVEMVACLPERRGRGIGEAMTWVATLADPDRPAMLMASDDGRGIYARMGFLPVLRMTLWFSPGQVDGS